jgi:hypothetical protein
LASSYGGTTTASNANNQGNGAATLAAPYLALVAPLFAVLV